MIKNDLVDALSEKTSTYGVPKSQIKDIVSDLFDILKDELIEGGDIQIRNFGKFTTRYRKPYPINHPSGKVVMSHAKRQIHFYPAKTIKKHLREDKGA